MRALLYSTIIGSSLLAAAPASTQTAAEMDASLDAAFGVHEPYRQFFEQLQKAVAANEKAAVASMIDYPFRARIKGKAIELRDATHFVQAYDKIVTAKVKHAISSQTYPTMFANWQGVSIGDGEVWFSGVDGNDKIKVIAIND